MGVSFCTSNLGGLGDQGWVSQAADMDECARYEVLAREGQGLARKGYSHEPCAHTVEAPGALGAAGGVGLFERT